MPPVFQLVFFDIDGTLVDSGDVWGPAVQRAMCEVFERKKIPFSVPSLSELEKVIGIPGHEALHPFIPPEHRELIPEISNLVGEYGPSSMRAGAGRIIPGCREVLEELRRRGAFLALASNCGQSYIRQVSETMGIGDLVDQAFCLETPGVRSKADMISLGMETFGTRRALMVGDRFLDLQAAHANGIPFLAYSGGFGESVEWESTAEGVIHAYDQFLPTIEKRAQFFDRLSEEIGVGSRGAAIGIAGNPLSGKSVFAEELAEALRARKVPVRLHGSEEFSHPAKAKEELRPKREGEIVLCDGMDFQDRSLRRGFHRMIHLEVDGQVARRRFEGKARRLGGEAQEDWARRATASEPADPSSIRIDNTNLLDPKRLA